MGGDANTALICSVGGKSELITLSEPSRPV